MAMSKLEQLIKDAEKAATAAKSAREETLPQVVQAVRALEAALQAALNGEPLRGLKNIGTAGVALYGARIRADDPDTKIPHFADRGSAVSYLCLDARGALINCWWVDPNDDSEADDWELHSARAEDGDLRVEDIEGVARALHVVLPRHIKSARKNAGKYVAMQKLAFRMRDAMAAASPGNGRSLIPVPTDKVRYLAETIDSLTENDAAVRDLQAQLLKAEKSAR